MDSRTIARLWAMGSLVVATAVMTTAFLAFAGTPPDRHEEKSTVLSIGFFRGASGSDP